MKEIDDIKANQMDMIKRLIEIKDLLTTPEGELKKKYGEMKK
jgi:hypothetical protein